MKLFAQLGICCTIFGFALTASAADLAILRNGFSLRHERREQIGSVTRLYLTESGYIDVATNQIASFQQDLAPTPTKAEDAPNKSKSAAPDLRDLVSAASERHQVDPDLIASVIHAESNFNPKAVSRKGARGLMQLMPGTASQLGVADAFEPEANVDAGTRYLRDLLVRYKDDIPKALAAYNAGAQRVQQYQGVPPYRETRAYVTRIIREFNRKKLASAPARSDRTRRPKAVRSTNAKQNGRVANDKEAPRTSSSSTSRTRNRRVPTGMTAANAG